MKDSFFKGFKLLLLILFPLGILYCVLHTMTKDFTCFIGALLIVGIGILVGIYIMDPMFYQNIWDAVVAFFNR